MYVPLIRDAVRRVLADAGVDEPDHVIVSSPHARAAKTAAKQFPGRLPEESPPIGYAGAADVGIRLAAVLDRAGPGESILVVSAVDGCDAMLLRTTPALERRRAAEPVSEQAEHGRDLLYATYLTWRGLLEREPPRRPEPDRPAGPPSARAETWKFAFVGSRCEACGRVHLPPRRVCAGCGAVKGGRERRVMNTMAPHDRCASRIGALRSRARSSKSRRR